MHILLAQFYSSQPTPDYDKFAAEGARRGMLGYVIEVYGDGNYEVEFSDQRTGVTLAQFVVGEDDVVVAPESSTECPKR